CKGTAFLNTDKTFRDFFDSFEGIYAVHIIYYIRARKGKAKKRENMKRKREEGHNREGKPRGTVKEERRRARGVGDKSTGLREGQKGSRGRFPADVCKERRRGWKRTAAGMEANGGGDGSERRRGWKRTAAGMEANGGGDGSARRRGEEQSGGDYLKLGSSSRVMTQSCWRASVQ
ncbi:MAG: hypothetical protein IJ615_09160, partial [Bacteroidaceae bacterium]|nr:hypothetical protein [Bacteroidaceae bacterium]